MVSMVSMEVSKTLGPGSSPGTPAIGKEKEHGPKESLIPGSEGEK